MWTNEEWEKINQYATQNLPIVLKLSAVLSKMDMAEVQNPSETLALAAMTINSLASRVNEYHEEMVKLRAMMQEQTRGPSSSLAH